MRQACLLVGFHARIPHLCGFHLRRFQAAEQVRTGVQAIHTYCFHGMTIAWKHMVCKWGIGTAEAVSAETIKQYILECQGQ